MSETQDPSTPAAPPEGAAPEKPQVRITAEPQVVPTNCLFRVDRVLHVGTLYSSDPEWAQRWFPLAAALFEAVPEIRGVRVSQDEVLITLREVPEDWRTVARTAGQAIRAHVQSGGPIVVEGAAEALEGDDLLRHRAQKVIDEQLNPNLASHGGWVEIQASEGRDLYLTMGGGCQGCGAAAMTMQQGVEAAIRNEVPEIERILDATDHSAGTNPYYR